MRTATPQRTVCAPSSAVSPIRPKEWPMPRRSPRAVAVLALQLLLASCLLVGCEDPNGAATVDADTTSDTSADIAQDGYLISDVSADSLTDTLVSPDVDAPIGSCAGSCGNGVCDPGESPGSCPDCPKLAGLACMEIECQAEQAFCSPKAGCQLLSECFLGCGGTPACAEGCKYGHDVSGVVGAFDPLATCFVAHGCGSNCGNGTCDAGESSGNCPADCKQAIAGNKLCEPGETPLTCSLDCGIVDMWACAKQTCPDVWAACEADPACQPAVACYGACQSEGCMAACSKQLGSALPPGFTAIWQCAKKTCDNDPKPLCGNGLCEGAVDACPADCAVVTPVCGNGKCEAGESSAACVADCGPAIPVTACLAKHCAPFDTACKANPGCADLLTCLAACPLTKDWKTCKNACFGQLSGMSYWVLEPLDVCGDLHGCEPDLPPFCGDHKCQSGESEANCMDDCFEPTVCGDGWCASTETAESCPDDCLTCETSGCPKEGHVCCKVSGKFECTSQEKCDV